MKKFEFMYIVKPYDLKDELKPFDDERVKKTLEKIRSKYSELGFKVEKMDDWGKKRLAYEMQDYHEGYYVLDTVVGDGEAVEEMNRYFRYNEEVLRHMIIRKHE